MPTPVKHEMLNFVNGPGPNNRKEAGSTLRRYKSSNRHLSSSINIGLSSKRDGCKASTHQSGKESQLSVDIDPKTSINAKARLDRVLTKLRRLAPIPGEDSDDADIQAEEIIKIWREELDEMLTRERELRVFRSKQNKASFSPDLEGLQKDTSAEQLLNAYRLLIQEQSNMPGAKLDLETEEFLSVKTVPISEIKVIGSQETKTIPIMEMKLTGSQETKSLAEAGAKPCKCLIMEQELTELRKEIKTLRSALQKQKTASDHNRPVIVVKRGESAVSSASNTNLLKQALPEQIDESSVSSPISKNGLNQVLPELIDLIEEQINPQSSGPHCQADFNTSKVPLLYSKISLLETDLAAARIRCQELDSHITSMVSMVTFALEQTESMLASTIPPIKLLRCERDTIQELQLKEAHVKNQAVESVRSLSERYSQITSSQSSQTEDYEITPAAPKMSPHRNLTDSDRNADNLSVRGPSDSRLAAETALEAMDFAAVPEGSSDVLSPVSAILKERASDAEQVQPPEEARRAGNYARNCTASVVLALRVSNTQYTGLMDSDPGQAYDATAQNPRGEQKEQVQRLLRRIDELTKERNFAVKQMHSHDAVLSKEIVRLIESTVLQVKEVVDAIISEEVACDFPEQSPQTGGRVDELETGAFYTETLAELDKPKLFAGRNEEDTLNPNQLSSGFHHVDQNDQSQSTVQKQDVTQSVCYQPVEMSVPASEHMTTSNGSLLQLEDADIALIKSQEIGPCVNEDQKNCPENKVYCKCCQMQLSFNQKSKISQQSSETADAQLQTEFDVLLADVSEDTRYTTCEAQQQTDIEVCVKPQPSVSDDHTESQSTVVQCLNMETAESKISSLSPSSSKRHLALQSSSPNILDLEGDLLHSSGNGGHKLNLSTCAAGIQAEYSKFDNLVDAEQQTDTAEHSGIVPDTDDHISESSSHNLSSETCLHHPCEVPISNLSQNILDTISAMQALDDETFSKYDDSECNALQKAWQMLQQVVNQRADTILKNSSQTSFQNDLGNLGNSGSEANMYSESKFQRISSESSSRVLDPSSRGPSQTGPSVIISESKVEMKKDAESTSTVVALSDHEVARRGASMLMKTNLKLSFFGSERSPSDFQKKELGSQTLKSTGSSRLVGELATPAVIGEDAAKRKENMATELDQAVNQLRKEQEKVKELTEQRDDLEKQSYIKARAALNSKMQQSSYGSLVEKCSTTIKTTVLSPMDQFNPEISDNSFHIPKFPTRMSKHSHQKSPLFHEPSGRFAKSKEAHGKSTHTKVRNKFDKDNGLRTADALHSSSIEQRKGQPLGGNYISAETRQKFPVIERTYNGSADSALIFGHKDYLDQMLKVRSDTLDFPNISGAVKFGSNEYVTGGPKPKMQQKTFAGSDLYAIDEHASSWLD